MPAKKSGSQPSFGSSLGFVPLSGGSLSTFDTGSGITLDAGIRAVNARVQAAKIAAKKITKSPTRSHATHSPSSTQKKGKPIYLGDSLAITTKQTADEPMTPSVTSIAARNNVYVDKNGVHLPPKQNFKALAEYKRPAPMTTKRQLLALGEATLETLSDAFQPMAAGGEHQLANLFRIFGNNELANYWDNRAEMVMRRDPRVWHQLSPDAQQYYDQASAAGHGFQKSVVTNLAISPAVETATGVGARWGSKWGPWGTFAGGTAGFLLATFGLGPQIQKASDDFDKWWLGDNLYNIYDAQVKADQKNQADWYKAGSILANGVGAKPTNPIAPFLAGAKAVPGAVAKTIGSEFLTLGKNALKSGTLNAAFNLAGQMAEKSWANKFNPFLYDYKDTGIDFAGGLLFGGDPTPVGKPGTDLSKSIVEKVRTPAAYVQETIEDFIQHGLDTDATQVAAAKKAAAIAARENKALGTYKQKADKIQHRSAGVAPADLFYALRDAALESGLPPRKIDEIIDPDNSLRSTMRHPPLMIPLTPLQRTGIDILGALDAAPQQIKNAIAGTSGKIQATIPETSWQAFDTFSKKAEDLPGRLIATLPTPISANGRKAIDNVHNVLARVGREVQQMMRIQKDVSPVVVKPVKLRLEDQPPVVATADPERPGRWFQDAYELRNHAATPVITADAALDKNLQQLNQDTSEAIVKARKSNYEAMRLNRQLRIGFPTASRAQTIARMQVHSAMGDQQATRATQLALRAQQQSAQIRASQTGGNNILFPIPMKKSLTVLGKDSRLLQTELPKITHTPWMNYRYDFRRRAGEYIPPVLTPEMRYFGDVQSPVGSGIY